MRNFKINESQKKYLSDQFTVVGSILFASLIVARFTERDMPFKMSEFLISLLLTLTCYAIGVLIRRDINA